MPRSLVPNQFDYAGVYVKGARSQFGFNKVYSSSFMSGMLVPLGDPIPVFPGTRLDLQANMTVRSNTLLAVPLDGMYLDVFAVWVPHRIVWTGMPQFLGENDATAWTQSVQLTYPSVALGQASAWIYSYIINEQNYAGDIVVANNFIAPHYGLIVPATGSTSDFPVLGVDINVLAFRGYYSIWNHFFRDENYQRPVLFSKGNTANTGEFGYLVRDYNFAAAGSAKIKLGIQTYQIDKAVLMPVNKLHDAYTSLIPEPQFGDVTGFLSGEAPILYETADSLTDGSTLSFAFEGAGAGKYNLGSATETLAAGYFFNDEGDISFESEGDGRLYADLSRATSTVNSLRASIMYNNYITALARGGRRVVEYYQNIYDVKNSEAAKDYPQMLSHQRYMLGVNQVVATADSSGEGWTSHLGDTGGYSLTQLRDVPICMQEFTEFGYLHILYCVRADNRYSTAIPEHFFRKELLDEYNPYFDHIGDVGIKSYMVNSLAGTDTNFGYQEAWWFERSQTPGITAGALNKNYGSLSFWTLGEAFATSLEVCTPGYLCFAPEVFNDIMVASYWADYQFIIDSVVFGKKAAKMSQHSIPGTFGFI